MKKILGTTLAAALLIPGPANAEILKNLKVNGQLDIQSTAARNTRDFTTRGDTVRPAAGEACAGAGAALAGAECGNDRIGSVITRLLLDTSWDLLDDVHAQLTFRKNDRHWGDTGNGGLGQGAGASQNLLAGGGIGTAINVDRSNITIDKLFGHVDTTLGRQYYGEPGDLIIAFGPKDNYGLYVTAIDAARFEMANDWMALSGLAGKQTSNASFGPTNSTNVRGLDVLWKSLPIKAHTYLWNRVVQGTGQLGAGADGAPNATGKNDNLWVYGIKLRGEAMGGWINADIAANGGEDRSTLGAGCYAQVVGGPADNCNATGSNYTGKALLLDAGYNAEMSGIGALTPWVNFGFGTGRSSNFESTNEGFQSIATDYRPGIINRRFSQGNTVAATNTNLGSKLPGGAVNTAGLNNRVVYGLGLNVTPAAWEKLTVGLQWWNYNLQRVTQSTVTNSLGATKERGAKHLGSEIGLTADWKHSENVKVGLGGSIYSPGGVIKQQIGNLNGAGVGIANNPATLAFADFTVKF